MQAVYSKQNLATPPSESSPEVLSTAQTVLRAQAQGLTYIADLYDRDSKIKDQFFLSLQYMHNAILSNGKIVVSGMGKSYKIADKLVATMNSLGVHATTLHPSDALHGDLGVIKPTDVVVLITASGNTPELLTIVPHIQKGIPLICLTCTLDSPLGHQSTSLLPAMLPPNLAEKALYGLPAPSTTTTACLAVGDAVCITLAEMLVADLDQRKKNFGKWHPGGAIGKDYQKEIAGPASSSGVDLAVLRSKITAWESLPSFKGSLAESFASEIAVWRTCASAPYILVENEKYLVSTQDLSSALARSQPQSQSLSGNENMFHAILERIQVELKHQDVLLVRKCLDTQMAQLANVSLAVLYNGAGQRLGLYVE